MPLAGATLPAEEVLALIDGLRARGVVCFSGLGITVQLMPLAGPVEVPDAPARKPQPDPLERALRGDWPTASMRAAGDPIDTGEDA